MIRNYTLILTILLCGLGSTFAASEMKASTWVDSLLQTMTLEEKIGQLLMIRAHSDLGPEHIQSIKSQISKYKVGGLCFFQGGPVQQARLTNEYQLLSDVPLLIATDAEWGLGHRFKEKAINFPYQLMLGAIQENRLIHQMGLEIGRQLRKIGVHVNFAPVADINNNPNNPVINFRSFGEDRYNVTTKSYMYMKGLQDAGVVACAKHFPGHGDTDVDSHYDLPVVAHSRSRLDSIELFPFRILIQKGLESIMSAHVMMPSLEDQEIPATLSEKVMTDLLRDQLGFRGLIFTDALEMKGVQKSFSPGQIEIQALLAGNDILTLPQDVGLAIDSIKAAVMRGILPEEDIDEKVRKILHTKYRLGLVQNRLVALGEIEKDLWNSEALALKSRLIEAGLTLVRDEQNVLPIPDLQSVKLASLAIGAEAKTTFQKRLDSYSGISHFQTASNLDADEAEALLKKLSRFDMVLISLHGMSQYSSREFGLPQSTRTLISRLNEQARTVLVVFGNPYSLKFFEESPTVVLGYQDDETIQDLTAQAVFGALPFRGRLPVSVSDQSRYNQGVITTEVTRVGYNIPERVGMIRDSLDRIAEIVEEMIKKEAAPGCQIIGLKDGKIFYDRSFGFHTYKQEEIVRSDELYDLASITKIAATTIAVMHLADQGLIDIEEPIGRYLPAIRGTNKSNLIIESILAHHSGLRGYLPFYKETVSENRIDPKPLDTFYSSTKTAVFSIPVAKNLFLKSDYINVIYDQIFTSDLRKRRNYRYSDLGFYLLGKMIEEVSGVTLDRYMQTHFYDPLGLRKMQYNPWQSTPVDRIIPTENDGYFRKQVVHGFVHDPGAAMLGGVSGHAGLFANAEDVAILTQMLMNGGEYGGRRFLSPEIIERFTKRYYRSSRRGLGFDMKELNPNRRLNMSPLASKNAYGHTGFTGTSVWSDPNYNLIFVFLSNRTFPAGNNRLLLKEEYRERLHTALYHSIYN